MSVNQKYKFHGRDALGHVVLFILSIISIFPLYWMVATSLKPVVQTFQIPPVWFFKPTLIHYYTVFFEKGMLSAFINSFVVGVLTTALALLVGSLAAYSLDRYNLKFKSDIWFWIITNRMLPPVVIVIPFFLLANSLNLLDTKTILVIVNLTFNLPLVVWIMMGFFQKIPKEIDEAARVDGCSHWKAFVKVILPLSSPGLVTTGILTFIFSWNELLFALVLTRSSSRTMPVLASTFMTGYGTLWGPISATGVFIAIPIIVFSLIVSRHLVRGLTLGAGK